MYYFDEEKIYYSFLWNKKMYYFEEEKLYQIKSHINVYKNYGKNKKNRFSLQLIHD